MLKNSFFPEFNSNKTYNLRSMIQNIKEKPLNNSIPISDYFIIFICLIVIILSSLLIFYVYKKLERLYNREENQKENEQEETNESNERVMIEMHLMNAKTFSFLPISSPIKINGSKNPNKSNDNSDDSEEKTNDSSNKIKNGSNHAKMKIENISSFNENKSDDNIEEVIKI